MPGSSYAKLEKMPKEKRCDPQTKERLSGPEWWDNHSHMQNWVVGAGLTRHFCPSVLPRCLQGLCRHFKWEIHYQCTNTSPQSCQITDKQNLTSQPCRSQIQSCPNLCHCKFGQLHWTWHPWRVNGSAMWIHVSHLDYTNICSFILYFLYLDATTAIEMHHLAMGKGHKIFFSHWRKAIFSCHYTTQAVRNLVFSCTPAVLPTSNCLQGHLSFE